MSAPGIQEALIRAASAPYWQAGFFPYFRARGKLRMDPAFSQILRDGLLEHSQRILDLGCGQGLLAAWLLAARSHHDDLPHRWPPGWSPPPAPACPAGRTSCSSS
jgi:SAM-dependent methyltransferase